MPKIGPRRALVRVVDGDIDLEEGVESGEVEECECWVSCVC